MLREIRELGFEYAELSHGIRMSLLPGICDAVEAGEIKISTLHNFCPLPMGVMHANPNLYRFTALEEREWNSAYRHTLRTVETAVRLKAQLIVLHLGSVDMRDYTDKLIDYIETGHRHSPKYAKLCDEMSEKRERRKEKNILRAYELLRLIVSAVEPHGIKLGIENREALEEIPIESDYPFLFEEFPSPLVCYWHDTGHAQIKENLGFLNHAMHLGLMADRLAGFHIHDVQYPARDHCAPGTGSIDFAALRPFVRPEHIKVFEMSPGVPVEDVKRGVAHIKSLWGEE